MIRKEFVFCPRDFSIQLGTQTKIMGIVNITPDSFSQDGVSPHKKKYTVQAVRLAHKLIQQGADMIDIGGESSRPGASRVSVEEELSRILPAIKILAPRSKVPVSIDTYKPAVAEYALDAGASIINNIKALQCQTSLLKMIARYNAGIVLMHMRGSPQTMQKKIHYHHLIDEIILELRKSLEKCLEIGIKSDKIVIDPGIGFGKTAEHNLKILNCLSEFKILKQPILIGTSRKSFIGKVLNKDPRERVAGTAATVCVGILKGAHIVRVHDVAEISDAVKMTDAIINQK